MTWSGRKRWSMQIGCASNYGHDFVSGTPDTEIQTVGSPAPVDTSVAQRLQLWLREHCGNESKKIVRARGPRSLPWNGRLQKWLHRQDLNRRANLRRSQRAPPLHKELQATGGSTIRQGAPDLWCLLREGELISPRDELLIRCPLQNGLSRLYIYIRVHTHTYITHVL